MAVTVLPMALASWTPIWPRPPIPTTPTLIPPWYLEQNWKNDALLVYSWQFCTITCIGLQLLLDSMGICWTFSQSNLRPLAPHFLLTALVSMTNNMHTLIAPQVVSGENTVMPAQNTGPALSRGKPSGTLMMNLIIIMMMSLRIMTMIIQLLWQWLWLWQW